MKSFRSLFLALSAVALCATGCQEPPYINGPGNNDNNPEAIPTAPIPEGIDIPDSAITVAQARAKAAAVGVGGTTPEKYYIKGWVQNFDEKRHKSGIFEYGNATFYMADVSTGQSTRTFIAFQVYGKDSLPANNIASIQVGDYVVVYGAITNYNGTAETPAGGVAYIYSSSNEKFNSELDSTYLDADVEGVQVPENTLTVYQAVRKCKELNGATGSDKVYVKGFIRHINSKSTDADVSKYGNATFYIAPTNDEMPTASFCAYRAKGLNGGKLTRLNQVSVGDFVVLTGNLTSFKGNPQMTNCNIVSSSNPNLK